MTAGGSVVDRITAAIYSHKLASNSLQVAAAYARQRSI